MAAAAQNAAIDLGMQAFGYLAEFTQLRQPAGSRSRFKLDITTAQMHYQSYG
jgi:hypothetical protein